MVFHSPGQGSPDLGYSGQPLRTPLKRSPGLAGAHEPPSWRRPATFGLLGTASQLLLSSSAAQAPAASRSQKCPSRKLKAASVPEHHPPYLHN